MKFLQEELFFTPSLSFNRVQRRCQVTVVNLSFRFFVPADNVRASSPRTSSILDETDGVASAVILVVQLAIPRVEVNVPRSAGEAARG